MLNIFSSHPLYLLIRCALPNCISSVFFSLYYIIDGIFVGRFLGSEDLATMGLIMPFVIIGFALTDMIAIGASVRITLVLGKGKNKEASILFSTSLVFIILLSCVVALCAFLCTPFFIELLDISQDSKIKALSFAKIYMYFAPFIGLYFALDNYLRICAKNIYSMCVNIIMTLSNIILDYLFIVIFGWGLFSAALATCIALSMASILGGLPFIFGDLSLKFSKILFKIKTFAHICYNGSSEFLSNISGSILSIFANLFLLKLAGIQAVAAFSIILYIDTFIVIFIMSLCEGMQAPLSYNYAKKDKVRLKLLIAYILASAFILCLAVFLGIMTYAKDFVLLFAQKNDAHFIAFCAFGLSVYALKYSIAWINICTSAFLTAFGKAHYSFFLSLIGDLLAPLCALFLLGYFFGLNGIWCAAFVGDLLCVTLSFMLLLRAINQIKR